MYNYARKHEYGKIAIRWNLHCSHKFLYFLFFDAETHKICKELLDQCHEKVWVELPYVVLFGAILLLFLSTGYTLTLGALVAF